MKNSIKILALLMVLCGLVMLQACKKSHDPSPLNLSTVVANDIDLNGSTPPSNVPVNAVITVTFSTNVDASTASASNVTLTRDFDQADVPLTLASSGKALTITPTAKLNSGALYILSLGAGLKSTDGIVFVPLTRSFTTSGSFEPDGVVAHWSFENNTNDVAGTFNASASLTHDITFVDSRNTLAGKAASFNGTTSIIEIPNGDQLMTHHDFAISFWVKANSTKNGHFVLGLAAWYGFQFEIGGEVWTSLTKSVKLATQYELATGTASEDTWYNGNPNGWQGSTVAKDVTSSGGVGVTYFQDKWAHVVVMYKASTKVGSMFINNDKVREWDFNLWPAGDAKKGALGVKFAGNATGNNFAIGFIQGSANRVVSDTWADPADPANNHFKGLLDDIRIYSRALTTQEIGLMFNSEK